ncbi:hypothetical protein MMC20_001667 [Loxospora ochrophaea]|nr:hypothetical protein [Loxospora ochrophaea]
MLSRTSTAFSIPRKPVPHSRNTSVDSTCASRYPSVISNPQSLRRKSIVETSQSTLDFLNGLDAKLPKSPPPAHARSDSEPVFTLHRRASEQSLRLRAHLEERQEIERRLQDFDTILEEEKQLELDERPFYSPLRMHSTSHMMHDQASRPSQHLPGTRPNRAMTSPELPRSRHVPSPSRSKLIYSSSLAETEQPTKPTMALKPLPVPTELVPSTRSRISQWLWRTVSLKSTDDADSQMDPPSWYHHHPHMTFVPERKASLSTVSSATHVNNALGSPWSTPRSSPHKKGSSSLSSYQTNPSSAPCRALSFDVDVDLEKHPIVTDVGVAF